MSKKIGELSDNEWRIMKEVWKRDLCTVPDVQEALYKETQWAYSTVKTMMDRMVGKGILRIERIRNLNFYHPCFDQKKAQKGEILRTLHRAFDGALTPLMEFLLDGTKVSQKQIQEIETLLKRKRNISSDDESGDEN